MSEARCRESVPWQAWLAGRNEGPMPTSWGPPGVGRIAHGSGEPVFLALCLIHSDEDAWVTAAIATRLMLPYDRIICRRAVLRAARDELD